MLPVALTRATELHFGGKELEYLYVSGGGSDTAGSEDGASEASWSRVTYRRKLNVRGVPPGSAPLHLPPWGAG